MNKDTSYIPSNGVNTVATAAALTATASSNEHPEWLRLPQPSQRCRFTGLSRSTLTELCIDGPVNGFKAPVRSVVLRKRNATRGIRLISFDSLMAYLESLTTKPEYDEKLEEK